jgi:hypothetical protein
MGVSRDSLLLRGGLNLFDSHTLCFSFSFYISLSLLKFTVLGFAGETALRRNCVFGKEGVLSETFCTGMCNGTISQESRAINK